MPYIIKDDKGNYVVQSSDGIDTTTDKAKATKWSKESKATNCKKTLPDKRLFRNMRVVEIAEEEPKQPSVSVSNPVKQTLKVAHVEPVSDLIGKANEMIAMGKQLSQRCVYLNQKLSEVDLEISDIEHAAEFYTLSASEGYKIYKMLHDARVRRRNIKNEMDQILMLRRTTLNEGVLQSLKHQIAKMENPTYKPRALPELFGDISK